MKILVAYYTRTKTTGKLASAIAGELKADIEEIVDKKDRAGAINWLIAGKDAAKKMLTDIEPNKHNPAEYDIIIIGTPVWVGTMAPAVRTYIENNKQGFKRVAFFATQGSDKEQKVFADLKELIGQEPAAKMFLTTKEVRTCNISAKVSDFISKIK